MSKSSNEYYHDKGAQDRSRGAYEYEPPYGIIENFLTAWTHSEMDKQSEANAAYKSGWENTDSQIKGK